MSNNFTETQKDEMDTKEESEYRHYSRLLRDLRFSRHELEK